MEEGVNWQAKASAFIPWEQWGAPEGSRQMQGNTGKNCWRH